LVASRKPPADKRNTLPSVSELLVGYARVSTDAQDLTAQRDGLQALGVKPDRIDVDHGLTGSRRDQPGLRQALAACRAGDTLVVTKLDRLARSLPNPCAIAHELTSRQVKLALGTAVHDPTDPVGRVLFNVLAMVAEFEADLYVRARARACASPRPRAVCAASGPSSARCRKSTSSDFTALARTR
jgi:DNA invertase Pin-like site-specific DNA recombinase